MKNSKGTRARPSVRARTKSAAAPFRKIRPSIFAVIIAAMKASGAVTARASAATSLVRSDLGLGFFGVKRFADRRAAGRRLAARLRAYRETPDLVVLALPRGGVPVAYEIALALKAPLDILVVRKLGCPGHEELAIGALAPGGVIVLDPQFTALVSREELDDVTRRELVELERRELTYRDGRTPVGVDGKTVILVDDGLATGASMIAAIRSLRTRAKRVVVAVPVAPRQAVDALTLEADDVVVASIPDAFYAVGAHYEDFSQTTDAEVRELLRSAYTM